jgi:hypothetical protein
VTSDTWMRATAALRPAPVHSHARKAQRAGSQAEDWGTFLCRPRGGASEPLWQLPHSCGPLPGREPWLATRRGQGSEPEAHPERTGMHGAGPHGSPGRKKELRDLPPPPPTARREPGASALPRHLPDAGVLGTAARPSFPWDVGGTLLLGLPVP